ncbi:MAG TPA: endonuclease III [Vicinamibacteria bacterium]|nr:endonuclease III [Vicinamibacteria bacterium]
MASPRPRTARRAVRSGAAAPRRRREARGLLAERANKILDILEEAHPEATCALQYRNAFELVTATILSAQCTDERVNMVTPALFARYPSAEALAAARAEDVEEIIRPTGFYRAKTKSLLGCARALATDHGGQVPRSMEAMVELPGVGRKTASVVLGHAYDIAEGIAVDTHVLRVSNRLAIARGDDPINVERQLMALIPQPRWTRTTDLLIFHGRKICVARAPRCGECPVFALCRWPQRQAFALGTPPRAKGAPGRRARRRRAG